MCLILGPLRLGLPSRVETSHPLLSCALTIAGEHYSLSTSALVQNFQRHDAAYRFQRVLSEEGVG